MMFEGLLKKLHMGHVPPEAFTIRDVVARNVAELMKAYHRWYSEDGLYLPPEYEADPSGWTEALRKMSRAFQLVAHIDDEDGELHNALHKWDSVGEKDVEEIRRLEDEIIEGFTLFGKNLYYLKDDKRKIS